MNWDLKVDDIAQLEQNLAEIYTRNISIMTKSLEQYKNQIQNLQKKYDMLREDYQYNLKVVSERDNELKKCDNRISKLSTVDIFEWNVDKIDDFSNESNWRKLSNANKEFE